MRIFYFFVLMGVWYSYKHDRRNVSLFKTTTFVLMDTSFKATECLQFDEREYQFPIYYIGLQRDTIRIGRSYKRYWKKWANDFTTPIKRNFNDGTLNIFIDTSVHTAITEDYISKQGDILIDSCKHYNAYLLTMKNTGDTAINIGTSFSLILLNREIKNSRGQWIRPDSSIDKTAICGTNQPHLILKPGGILIGKVKRYRGNVVTDCRFAFGYDKYGSEIYSNTFKDSVDIRLFNQ